MKIPTLVLALGLLPALIAMPSPGVGDVFKYVDKEGKIYFTDSPLEDSDYRLEWKRNAKKFIDDNDKRLVAMGRRKPHGPTKGVPPKRLSVRRNLYANLIERTARQFNLHPELLHAVIRAESAYNPNAVSPAGAIGLMQLMPATAARYGVSDIYDPAQNIRGGARYLRFLLDLFKNDLRLALAGYNAGENAVAKYGNQIPPYKETQNYVRKVLQFLWAERASAAGT